ncbi:uncharacterized [Tachysurus ichikawai]
MGRVSYNRKTVFEERQQKGLAFLQCVYDSSGLNFALPLHDVKKTPGRAGDNVLYFVVRSCVKYGIITMDNSLRLWCGTTSQNEKD